VWHPFSRSNSSMVNKLGSGSEPQRREQVPVTVYWQLIIPVFAMAAWGLYEEDVENKLRSLLSNRRLFQCPVCDRQKVAVLGKTRTCSGRGLHHHRKELMIAVGRRDSR
jgi:hypothetical protein